MKIFILILVFANIGFAVKEEKVTEIIKNNGKEAIKKIYKVTDGKKTLAEEHYDLTGTGQDDVVYFYNDEGKKIKTLYYSGFEAKVLSAITHYDPQTSEILKKEYALGNDGKINEWKYYFKGNMVKREFDRNTDGKSDVWEYFTDNKSAKIEYDNDFDGQPDKFGEHNILANQTDKITNKISKTEPVVNTAKDTKTPASVPVPVKKKTAAPAPTKKILKVDD